MSTARTTVLIGIPALAAIEPQPGSRDGWHFKHYLRIGRAKIPDRRRGGHRLYGVYGIRETAAGWEVLAQDSGREESDGTIWGLSLLSSSMDSEPYLWNPSSWFAEISIFPI